ncbi:ATP-binding protein [Halomicrobium sp. HM KBTZ05]|uniref:ATP-binding protein n=1 Tax=Halomicrobium sp. HM KBTZ05 TaxID=3242663 RepID=UPI003557DA71
MTDKQTPKVNEVNEFLEISRDFEDPLELVRESLSNAYDAGATNVTINIRSTPTGSDIIIDDNGHGMDYLDLESFFDLGNSRKTDSIGYKGHGTKIFYKSDRIRVNTSKDSKTLDAVMERPWEKLNNGELPEYEVTETDAPENRRGTTITISGFRSGQGFEPERLTYKRVEHYLRWKTIAGSTAHYFPDASFRNMDITVDLDSEIDDTQPNLTLDNEFEFPDEQLDPGDGDFPAESMCKVFPPRRIEVPYEDGVTELEIVGMVGGKEARNQLPTYGRHSAQFGVWLAKDHIKVERLNEAISADCEFTHFMFVVNCQDIQLSANRGKIRNKQSNLYQAIEKEVDHYISKVSQTQWVQTYLQTRHKGELDRKAQAQLASLEERRSKVTSRERYQPSNDAEILFGLERASKQGEYQVEDFRPNEDIEAILSDTHGSLYNTAIVENLNEFFDAMIPIQSVDLIICWELGDRDQLREQERIGYLSYAININFDQNQIAYEGDSRGSVRILPVASQLDETMPSTEI